jgi:hypothetical protein
VYNIGVLVTPPNLISKVPKESRFDRVIVCGAGLSKAFGLPIATELLPECLSHSKRIGLKTNVVEELVAAFYPSADPDIEDLLGMAEAAKHYGSLRSSKLRGNRWRPAKVDQAVYQLRRSISAYFWHFQAAGLESKIAPLTTFVKTLGAKGTAYVTFNYDLLLESALGFAGIPFSYHLPAPSGGVVVLKPHGSVNWYDSMPSRIPVVKMGVGSATMFVAGDIFSNAGIVGNPAGFIVPPSPQKSIEVEFLRKIWTSFSSLVTNTRALSIIGYSMPYADRLARLVLRRAGGQFSNTKMVSVINKDSSARDHYRRLIDPRIEFAGLYFEELVAHLPRHTWLLGVK